MRWSKQWTFVLLVVAGLAVGVGALTYFSPDKHGVDIGDTAPNFRTLDLATGDSVSLRERYAGAVTLVNVWATWCGPCRIEMPTMQQTYDALAPHGFKIAAVSIDKGSREDVQKFASDLKLSFDILHDQAGRIQDLYHVYKFPESFLLDRHGTIVKHIIGAYDWNSPANRALIQRLLDEPGR
jgi:cytochrome c biogenesis protein CcmG/thiol:disulfide interchange protein DsbE